MTIDADGHAVRFVSAHSSARLFYLFTGLRVLAGLFAIAVGIYGVNLLPRIFARQVSQVEAHGFETLAQVAGIGSGAAALFAFIFLLVWTYRAYRNLPALGVTTPSTSPGMAVVFWLLPILFLYRPYEIAVEMWRAGDDKHVPGEPLKDVPTPALLPVWWGAWLLAGLLGLLASVFNRPRVPNDFITAQWAGIAVNTLGIASAVLTALVVRGIGRRQARKHAIVEAAPVAGTVQLCAACGATNPCDHDECSRCHAQLRVDEPTPPCPR